MTAETKTTIGSGIGAFGTLLTGIGFFGVVFPPLLFVGAAGAAISAGAKWYTGLNTAGVEPDLSRRPCIRP